MKAPRHINPIKVAAVPILLLLLLCSGCSCRYESLNVDGIRRDYLLHVPETLPPGVSVPLVLALHQFSDTPRGMRKMTGFDAIADREGFIVAYPRGAQRRWRSGITDDDRDIQFLDALLDALIEAYPVDADRVYAAGASAGAMMIQRFACHSDRLAAIAPVMGSLSASFADACQPATPVPALVIHGIEDPVIPYEGGRAGGPHESYFLSAEETAAFWARAAACDATPTTDVEPLDEDVFLRRYIYGCPDNGEVRLYAVGGCGHSWPGHRSRYPGCIVGPSITTLNASEIIWDFFQRHGRSASEKNAFCPPTSTRANDGHIQ